MTYKERIKAFYTNTFPKQQARERIIMAIETLERCAVREGLSPDDFLVCRDAKKLLRSE